MLINQFINRKNASPVERSRAVLAAGTAMIMLGIAGLVTLTLLETLRIVSLEQQISSYAHGFLFGISGGVTGAGISLAVSAWQRLHDPEKMRRFEIKSRDERNLAIQNAAARMTFTAALVIIYVLIIVCAFFSPEISMALAFLAIGLFLIYFFFIWFFSRRM